MSVKEISTWRWFKIYVSKLDYLERLLKEEKDINLRRQYFENLRIISEIYYNLNYNLEMVIENKKDSLNEKINKIFKNIQKIKKVIKKQKYVASSKEEKRVYKVVREQIKQLIKTIKDYYLLWMNDEENREKRKRSEINYYEEELEEIELKNKDPDYDPENEEDKYQVKKDKKYDKKYDKYTVNELDSDLEEDIIIEIDKNNPSHLRFIYV